MRGSRITSLAILGGVLVGGLVLQAAEPSDRRDVAAPPAAAGTALPAATPPGTLSSTWYCAGGSATKGGVADHVLLMTIATNLDTAIEFMGMHQQPVRRAVIVGATRLAELTADHLLEEGIDVVMIDIVMTAKGQGREIARITTVGRRDPGSTRAMARAKEIRRARNQKTKTSLKTNPKANPRKESLDSMPQYSRAR